MPDDKVERMAKRGPKKDGATRVVEGLSAGVSNVYALVAKDAEDFRELRIRQRGEGDWSGTLKYWGPDGTPMVYFGWGYDFLSCLMGVNAAVAGDKGRFDRPYEAPEGGGA